MPTGQVPDSVDLLLSALEDTAIEIALLQQLVLDLALRAESLRDLPRIDPKADAAH